MTTRGSDGMAVVPAVGTAGSLSVVRSLGRLGIDVLVVSERPSPPAAHSKYCTAARRVPDPAEDLPGYRDALRALARRPAVSLVVPVREPDVYVLARNRAAFARHVEPVWPTASQLETVHDRRQLYAVAQRAGVAVPETRPIDAVEDWDRERIVKARYALLAPAYVDAIEADRCVVPPKTVFLDPSQRPDTAALIERMGHVPIAQAYLDGEEYCFRALCVDGDPVATSQKRLVRGYKYARGPSVYHEAADRPGLEAAGRALLSELDWTGLASVGFVHADGEFSLLEVNPRVPASLPVDIRAGVDYPRLWWQLATGAPPDRVDYRPGTATHLLRGELVHLHSVLCEEYPLVSRPSLARRSLAVAASLLASPNFDLLSLDDPAPFVRDLRRVVADGLASGEA